MSGVGGFNFENKYGSAEVIYPREDLEMTPFITNEQRYKRNLLTNARKSSLTLEHQSLIDCLEADEKYIVSAGRDHDINVWDSVEGMHVSRLSGHRAPVTGLSLFNSGHSTFEKIIVSSSEDGSIRIWSLIKGEELHKIETGNVITCMGVINKSLAVTGNHKGYMEVHHLRSGDLYTSICAHADPIDALVVEGNYACTATFEAPSCLKVWDVQFEQTRCIYRIENSPEIEFCCLAVWNSKAILGASNQQKLLVIDFANDYIMEAIDFERPSGSVHRIKVWNEWIISCSIHKAKILLDVHRIHNYEHFGTFISGMQQVKAIAAIELDSNLKIIIGGSALVILSFDFNLTDEGTCLSFSRLRLAEERYPTSTATFIQDKELGNCIVKNRFLGDFHNESSTDSDSDYSEDETFPNCYEKIQMNFDDMHIKQENNEMAFITSPRKMKIFRNCYENRASSSESNLDRMPYVNIQNEDVQTESTLPRQTQMLSVLTVVKREACISPDMRAISPIQDIKEPRIVLKKLKEELDKNKQQEELEYFIKNDDHDEGENDDIVIVKDTKFEKHVDEDIIAEIIELEDDDNHAEETEVHSTEFNSNIQEYTTLITNEELKGKEYIKEEIQEEKVITPSSMKISSKKNKKCKKKESQKTKHRKCEIM